MTAEYNLDNLTKEGNESPSTESSEHELLVDRHRHISAEEAYKLRYVTLVVSWISVVYLGVIGITVFVMAFIRGNTTAFAFSLDALLDCASSAVVIWRYSGSAASLYSVKKDKVACIILGVLFIVSFASICTRSSISLASQDHPRPSFALCIISYVNIVVCTALMISKSVLARKLESIALATDAVNSGIGIIMAVSAIISYFLYDHNASIWYVDSLIGMISSVFLLIYGLWLIIHHACLLKASDDG